VVAGWRRGEEVVAGVAGPGVGFGILATAYTGFLFAQGLGRDLWQGPHAAIDLIAQSVTAGAAALLFASRFLNVDDGGGQRLAWGAAGGLLVHLMILVVVDVRAPSPSRLHELAVHTIRRGVYAPLFGGLAIAAGGALPIPMLVAMSASGPTFATMTACVLALAGGAAWDYIWVEAGQSVPLS